MNAHFSKRRLRPLSIMLGMMLGATGGAFSVAWYVSNVLNPVPRRSFADAFTFTPWELDVPWEEVMLTTTDHLKLKGWWLPRPDTRSVVIGCHGHLGSKDELLGIGSGMWRAGHNVLLFDFRGRGQSDPWPNTLVSREVDDLLAAVAYARSRLPEARIGVIGYSMGAAVSLLATAREPAIAALVADSPFSSIVELLTERMRQTLRIPPHLLVALTATMIERRHRYRIHDVRPSDAAAQIAPRPLLLIHGSEDSIIPVAHAHRLFAAARQPKELWIDEGAEHCGAYFSDRKRYVARVGAFFEQYLWSAEC